MIKRIILLYLSLIGTLLCSISYVLAKKKYFNKESDCVISFTSFPARINVVYLTVESIFRQSLMPSEFVLYLSKIDFPHEFLDLPKSLRKQISRGLLVKFVDGNLRSYKKLHYALDDFKSKKIVTIDDDVIYPSFFLEKLIDESNNFPDEVLFFRGYRMDFCGDKPIPYNQFSEISEKSSILNFPTGVSGILYPPNIFYKDVRQEDLFMSLAPLGDDIWYKSMTFINKKKCRLVSKKSIHFPPVFGSQNISLSRGNLNFLSSNKINNNTQMNAVFTYYNDLMDAIHESKTVE